MDNDEIESLSDTVEQIRSEPIVTQIGADGVRRPIDEIDPSALPVGGRSEQERLADEQERRVVEEQQFWDAAVADEPPIWIKIRFGEAPKVDCKYSDTVTAEQWRSVVEPVADMLRLVIEHAEAREAEAAGPLEDG